MSDLGLEINSDGSLTVFCPGPSHRCILGKPEVWREFTGIPLVQDCGRVIQGLHERHTTAPLEELERDGGLDEPYRPVYG